MAIEKYKAGVPPTILGLVSSTLGSHGIVFQFTCVCMFTRHVIFAVLGFVFSQALKPGWVFSCLLICQTDLITMCASAWSSFTQVLIGYCEIVGCFHLCCVRSCTGFMLPAFTMCLCGPTLQCNHCPANVSWSKHLLLRTVGVIILLFTLITWG